MASAQVAMGGVIVDGPQEDQVRCDLNAQNNMIDSESAAHVYEYFLAMEHYWFIVTSRHASAECMLPKSALEGSMHKIARRLRDRQMPMLERLYERCVEPEVKQSLAPPPPAIMISPEGLGGSPLSTHLARAHV